MDTIAAIIGKLIPANVKNYLDGRKAYAIAIIAGGTAIAQALGYNIPDWVFVLEGAAGLGAVRVAISKSGGAYNTGALPQTQSVVILQPAPISQPPGANS